MLPYVISRKESQVLDTLIYMYVDLNITCHVCTVLVLFSTEEQVTLAG